VVIELRHLRYFVAVAEQLSFTRAAALLHMAQPALSVQIRQLEDELGVELFDRSRRAIALTHAGETMLGETRRLLASLDRSVDLVRRVGAGAIGSIAVGFVPSASNSVLPTLLRRFWEAHPDVAVTLREMAPGDLVDGLHAGNLDISFLYLPFSDPLLDHLVIVREPFVAALPFDHPLARETTVDVADLRDEPFVTPADHGMMPGLHAKVTAICHAAGFVPRAVQDDVWLVQTIVALVAAGVGVALVPFSSQAQARAGVVYRPLRPRSTHEAELAAVWRRTNQSPALGSFLAEMRSGPNGSLTHGPSPSPRVDRSITGARP
jgi:DNA-binding transcriptional LysR family regulator